MTDYLLIIIAFLIYVIFKLDEMRKFYKNLCETYRDEADRNFKKFMTAVDQLDNKKV